MFMSFLCGLWIIVQKSAQQCVERTRQPRVLSKSVVQIQPSAVFPARRSRFSSVHPRRGKEDKHMPKPPQILTPKKTSQQMAMFLDGRAKCDGRFPSRISDWRTDERIESNHQEYDLRRLARAPVL
jgi:hypothetical protein